MRILTRYVLREFVVPLFYCLSAFLAIYVLFELFGSFSRMIEAKLPLPEAVNYFAGYLAPYFHYLAPAALMLATLYTMWTFCRNSEIVAMRASGVSFIAIVKPLLSVSLAMAAFVAWVNESYVPRASPWVEQLRAVRFDVGKVSRADNVVLRNSRSGRTWNIDEIVGSDGTQLSNVRVSVDRRDGTRQMNIVAPRADYLDGEWWFTDAKVQHYNASGQEIASAMPELDLLKMRSFPEFDECPEDFIMQNRPWKYNSVRDRLRYLKGNPGLSKRLRDDCIYDIAAQIVSPLACVIITLFAIPAGIASGRQSVFKGIVGALVMFFSFYALTILSMVLAKNGWAPPILAAIAPAVVFLALGIRAFIRQR
jgi:lipopolysaccharide export system permease protein